MPDLSPLTALGATAPQERRHGALTLTENPGLALASLALRQGAPVPAHLGVTLPGPGGWEAGDGIAAFWTGPDQWMIEAPGRAEEDIAAWLARVAPGCSVTEQTDGFAAFEITSAAGPAPVEALLSRLVNIDLAALAPGRAARTGFEHLSVFVIRRSEAHVAVLAMRSAAGSVWHKLTAAAARLEALSSGVASS